MVDFSFYVDKYLIDDPLEDYSIMYHIPLSKCSFRLYLIQQSHRMQNRMSENANKISKNIQDEQTNRLLEGCFCLGDSNFQLPIYLHLGTLTFQNKLSFLLFVQLK